MPYLDWNMQRYRTRDLLLDRIYPWGNNNHNEGNIIISQQQIIFNSFDNFPENGNPNRLYFDTDKKILYCYNESTGYKPVYSYGIVS